MKKRWRCSKRLKVGPPALSAVERLVSKNREAATLKRLIEFFGKERAKSFWATLGTKEGQPRAKISDV